MSEKKFLMESEKYAERLRLMIMYKRVVTDANVNVNANVNTNINANPSRCRTWAEGTLWQRRTK